jgi:hypothetical protein
MNLYLKATCFGLDTNLHPATKFTSMKRQVKNSINKTLRFLWDPRVVGYFGFTKQL